MVPMILALLALFMPVEVTHIPPVEKAVLAYVEEKQLTLQEKAEAIAEKNGLNPHTFKTLIKGESRWDPTADNGYDRGLLQINRTHHPEVSDECAFDAECAMNWAAEYIAKNGYDEWVVCNCFAYSRVLVPEMPTTTAAVRPNATIAVGRIALFKYGDKMHYAVVKEIAEEGFTVREANYEPCEMSERLVKWNDAKLVGFFSPTQ